jgi:phosphonate transport system permease protein
MEILTERGASATLATLSISVLAIALAGLVGALLAPFAAGTLAAADPYLGGPERRRFGRRHLVTQGVRLGLVVARAVPEYVIAFLLLAVFGPTAWPVVIALAIHNAGILGRLGSECIENVETPPLRALRGLGATRAQITVVGALPLMLGRYLLYFFYRFEACVRESTVLGMLGVGSLGYWIQESRAKQDYDELLLFVALGALLVMSAEIVSYIVRGAVRRA